MGQHKRAARLRGRVLLVRSESRRRVCATASLVRGKRRLSGLTPPTGHFIGRVFRDTEAPEATEPPVLQEDRP
jgi:hypothetical protein